MPKRNLVILFSFLFLLLASGCAPECTDEELATFNPILVSPADDSAIHFDNPPIFDWTHEESCTPTSYAIYFRILGGSIGHHFVDGDVTKFNMDQSFQAGTKYQWYVRAINTHKTETSVHNKFGPLSEARTFSTDGMCSKPELVAPSLNSPHDDIILGESSGPGPSSVAIEWSYPGDCIPSGYHYQLAADPGFTNIISSGIVDRTQFDEYYTSINVPKCAWVYWRVQARAGNESGDYSEPFRFSFSPLSSCDQNQQPIDGSLIKGYVFDDYCKTTVPWVPDGVGIFPPCVVGEPYGVHADGDRSRTEYIQEVTGETIPADFGISNVVVDLGAGPCPSTGLDQMITSHSGSYYFLVQSPGDYCVSIDKANNPELDHGIWTEPLTDQEITEATITFKQGDDLMFKIFGWDQNDFLKIDFWVDLTSFCRGGDSKLHPKLAIVEEGSVIPLLRRNEEGTWFETIVDGIPCLISTESGEPGEGVEGLSIFPQYSDPEPEDIEPDDSNSSPGPSPVNCSLYDTEKECLGAGCEWTPPGLIPSKCVPK